MITNSSLEHFLKPSQVFSSQLISLSKNGNKLTKLACPGPAGVKHTKTNETWLGLPIHANYIHLQTNDALVKYFLTSSYLTDLVLAIVSITWSAVTMQSVDGDTKP